MPAEIPTPIPVGSPHLHDRPNFDRFGLGYAKPYRADQRDYERRPIARDAWLVDGGSHSILRCRTNDISDAGLHADAPIGFGLGVGQRYEVRIAETQAGRPPFSGRIKSLGYGTVIRTELYAEGGESDRVGFAVRFDVPQLIDV
ncbi:MAG TPA: hypothetical protein VMV81_05550 [Phycisphaerae bacterium]|nr:hypothetical protein [Phycisphaerae bacterium]